MILSISFHGLMVSSMQPSVSVIVPVYKVESYLVRCLDSLQNQSLKNIEIILIDDASPDRCSEICKSYAAKDKRFKLFCHNENKGLSAARNTGIRLASSDYLMFVDSDDWVHEDFCKVAYECALFNQADLVMFGYQQILDNQKNNGHNQSIETVSNGFRTREEAIDLTFRGYGTVAWNKIYHRSLFKDITYPEGQLFEDTATTYKLIWNASRIYCMSTVLYYYLQRSDSITMKRITRKIIHEQFKVCWQECCDLSTLGFESEEFLRFKLTTALTYCIKSPINFADPYYKISADIIRGIKKAPHDFTLKQKCLVMLFQWEPKIFSLICVLWNKQVR